MEGAASTATGIPPLSLSSGPAISGGGAYYGGTPTTGDFSYHGRASLGEVLAQNLPLVAVAGVVAWLIFKR